MENPMKRYYVYYSYEEWGRGYIGKRECLCDPEQDDKYFGSFSDQTFNPTSKIVLAVFDSREECYKAESILHTFFKVRTNPHFANKAEQTSTYFSFDWTGIKRLPKTDDHIEKHRNSITGNTWFHKVSNDGTVDTRSCKEAPDKTWKKGRGPSLKRADRSDLTWHHRVKENGTIERKLFKDTPKDGWSKGKDPEGFAKQGGTRWYSQVGSDGSVVTKMFHSDPGTPWVLGRFTHTENWLK
jgi:hypothetical protein